MPQSKRPRVSREAPSARPENMQIVPYSPCPPANQVCPLDGVSDLVSDGSDEEAATGSCFLRSAGDSRNPQKTCMVTFAYSASAGARNPKDRKDAARICCQAAVAASLSTPGPQVVVKAALSFKEMHKNGKPHYHVVLVAEAKSKMWAHLDESFKASGLTPDIRVVEAPRGSDPVSKVLRYLMIPTRNKPHVDNNYYVSKGFEVPKNLVLEAEKAAASLSSKPASADEAFHYLCRHPDIVSYDTLIDHLNPAPGETSSWEAQRMRLKLRAPLKQARLTDAALP